MSKTTKAKAIYVKRVPIDEWDRWERMCFEDMTGVLLFDLGEAQRKAWARFEESGDENDKIPRVPMIAECGMLWVAVQRQMGGDEPPSLEEVAKGPWEFKKVNKVKTKGKTKGKNRQANKRTNGIPAAALDRSNQTEDGPGDEDPKDSDDETPTDSPPEPSS